jgi:hypothetical protein
VDLGHKIATGFPQTGGHVFCPTSSNKPGSKLPHIIKKKQHNEKDIFLPAAHSSFQVPFFCKDYQYLGFCGIP